MEHYGVNPNTIRWVENFLKDRTQRVLLEGIFSEPAPVLSGVPQGTVLGPLLFVIYINDLPKYVSPGTEVRLFSDDSAVYRAIKSREDHEILQRAIKSLEQWEADWSMSFHPEKCQLLRITKQRKPSHYVYNIHGVLIDSVKEAKYLGVTIDNKLSWSPHIHAVCKKAHNTL